MKISKSLRIEDGAGGYLDLRLKEDGSLEMSIFEVGKDSWWKTLSKEETGEVLKFLQ